MAKLNAVLKEGLRLRNCFFRAALLCAALVAAEAQSPAWYLDKELLYPPSRYIAAVGEGSTRADAESAALAAVSLFFDTKTDIRNKAIREFNEAISGETTSFSKKTYIKEDAAVRSEAEFLGVRFADPFFISNRKLWAALAFIDRQEAAGIYDVKIGANMAAINALVADAAAAEPLYACALLHRAQRIAGLTEEYIKTATLLDPKARAKYAPRLAAITEARRAYRSKREGLTFSVRVGGADEAGRVERVISGLLENEGYAVSGIGAPYTVNTRLTMTEEQYDAGVFIRSGITIGIERNGRSLFSYSKSYPRYGHKTPDGACNRAFMAIEKDLQENFITAFTAMVGR
jgi:hypothetical protein